MGFDLVAPKHVHGPGCGHSASQMEADAKPKAAAKVTAPVVAETRTPSNSSQFKMAEQASPRQESQNSKPLEQKSAFLGTAVQRFASSVQLPQKSEQSMQPQQSHTTQSVPQQSKAPQSQTQVSQSQTPQSPSTPSTQQMRPPVGEKLPTSPQGQVVVQKQMQPQQQPQTATKSQQATQSLPSQVVMKQAAAVATPTASQMVAQAAITPQAPVVPQRLPQTSVMTQLSQALTTQLFSAPKAAGPVMSGMLQTILKNMAPPTTLGLDGKEFAAMIMSFMMRERVERRKKVARKPTLTESRDVLAVEHPERDRTV